jgi:hypothetical protein
VNRYISVILQKIFYILLHLPILIHKFSSLSFQKIKVLFSFLKSEKIHLVKADKRKQ